MGSVRGGIRWLYKGRLAGVVTVEMAYIMPVVLLVFFLSILGIFYYHDKAVIASAAYETAVAGSTKAREKDGVTEAEAGELFQERVRGKCIFFGEVEAEVQVSETRIVVKATAAQRGLKVSVCETASITEPEERIRKWRLLQS